MAHENDWIAAKTQSEPDTWSQKTWSGLRSFAGNKVWTDGKDIYYSNDNQYVLNRQTSTWETKNWGSRTPYYGQNVWTDGDNIYFSASSTQYILDKENMVWNKKTWNGLNSFYGLDVWTDGTDYYYSSGDSHYILSKATSTWSVITWSGLTSFDGSGVWTDGENTYYSYGSNKQYVLNKETSTWSYKNWSGGIPTTASNVWTDNENVYYSGSGANYQYVLDKQTSTWRTKVWNGLTSFTGDRVWLDGNRVYYSSGTAQYSLNNPTSVPYRSNFPEMIESVDLNDKWVSDVLSYNREWSAISEWSSNRIDGEYVWNYDGDTYFLTRGSSDAYILNKSTYLWERINFTWEDGTPFLQGGSRVWVDETNCYYSYQTDQYILNKAESKWYKKTWTGLTNFVGDGVWSDGTNVYYSMGNEQYVLDKANSAWDVKTWNGMTKLYGSRIWSDGTNIYYSKDDQSLGQRVLNKATSTWETVTWYKSTGSTFNLDGQRIWTDGTDVYYSNSYDHYVLNKSDMKWYPKTWTGLNYFNGIRVWNDGERIYYSDGTSYELKKKAVTSVPYRYDFPEMIESKDIDNAWITHDVPDPATEGLRFLKLTYHLTVNWEGGGSNNISVSTDIPEAFKRSDHLWIYSGTNYRDVAMVINTEIPQCPYQCRMTFDSNANELVESLNNVSPKFYIYRTRNASRLAAFSPQNIDSALYSESIKNVDLVDDRTYLATPYNYACEPRVMFNFGDSSEGGELIHHSFPEEPGSTVVTIDIIFAFTADQDDRYADLLARYPDHLTPFEYKKNAVPYRPAFPALVESVDISDKWLISDDIPFRWNFPELIRSTANPVDPPSFFTFKGRSSAEFGSIEILPLCLKHEEKTDFINFITGTPYVLETSILRSKVITITINLKDISPANIDRVNSWLIGTGKLVLSRDPGRYYIATCNNALTGQRLISLGKVVVQFNVMPYKYDAKESDSFEAVSLVDETLHKTAAIYYKGSAPAESTFKITATGNIEIYNVQTEKTVEIKGLTEYCIIDIKARKVTDENDLNILDRTYGDIFDLMLAPGDNYFFLSGSVTAVEVKKKTRWY